jgi:hypothetical protein
VSRILSFWCVSKVFVFGDVVTYVAFLFPPVPSTIFSIALVMVEVATPR